MRFHASAFTSQILAGVLASFVPFCAPAKLRVAASTTFVGEAVAAIGGDAVEVSVIFPRDADPHEYEPTPRDIAKLENQRIVFENGFGLEAALQGPLKTISAETIDVSFGIKPRKLGDRPDVHVWLDPVFVMTWTTNIQAALTRLDPKNAGGFRGRAENFQTRLRELDSWIRAQTEKIPPERRVIVTDHDELGCFAARYGFKIIGTIMPGFRTLAEPSPRELAAIEETIRREKSPAVFAAGNATPALILRVAADTGAKIVSLPIEALGPVDSETGTLDGYLRVLTTRIVEALK